MYYVQDAHSFWDWIYFVVLIVIGSFFMMNLCLVIISAQFSVTKKRETERMLAEQRRMSPSSSSVSNDRESQPKGSCWSVLTSMVMRRLKAKKPKSQDSKTCCSPLKKIQATFAKLVDSAHFDRIIFVAILINTCSMAVEYHGQPQWLTDVLEYTNYVFVVIFTIEMVLKIIAGGCVTYVKSLFNLFDASIVIVSWIEILGTSKSGLSVLRTFRLLRVVKMMQFMPTLRKQCVRSSIYSSSMLYHPYLLFDR